MKKLTIIGLLVGTISVFLLLYWHHVKVARLDTDFRQHVAGVWLRQEADMQCTNTVAADGNFVEMSWFSHPGRTNTYRRTGTWYVKDGDFIETVKTSTNPTEVTPHTGAAQIIRANTDQFVVQWPNSVETVWKRVIQ
jgi:hypothetical protein